MGGYMKAYIKERTLQTARYIADSHQTIRKTAKVFNLSKSTVHNDISKRLPKADSELYDRVKDILGENFAEKHIRGGQATQRKFLNMQSQKNRQK